MGTGVFSALQSAGGFTPPASQSQQEANLAAQAFGRNGDDAVLLYTSKTMTVHSRPLRGLYARYGIRESEPGSASRLPVGAPGS